MNPGSIVKCRNREWVLLPSDDEKLLLLRPLTGATDEVVAVHKGLTDLIGYSFPEERVSSAKFPPPTPDDLSNVAGAHLLWQAANHLHPDPIVAKTFDYLNRRCGFRFTGSALRTDVLA